MHRHGHPEHAIRQIEFWYKHYVDAFVQEARTTPRPGAAGATVTAGRVDRHVRPINQETLSEAHETAWRHAVVKAQAQSNPGDWAAITASEETRAHLDLLDWSAAKYRVTMDSRHASVSGNGHRQHSR